MIEASIYLCIMCLFLQAMVCDDKIIMTKRDPWMFEIQMNVGNISQMIYHAPFNEWPLNEIFKVSIQCLEVKPMRYVFIFITFPH